MADQEGGKIRIAFVVDRVFSCQAGTEQQLLELIQSLDKQLFKVYLCCLRKTDFLQSLKNCQVHVCGVDSLFGHQGLRAAVLFVRFLKEEKIDIVQTFFRDANFFGVLCAKVARVPVIISSRRGEAYWKDFAGKCLIRPINAMTDYFFTNSHAVAKFLMEKEKVKRGRIEVVLNSIDTERLGQSLVAPREEFRSRLGLTGSEFVVGIVAGLRKVKRHDLFIQAAAQLCAAGGMWRFVVVGSGILEEQLKAMALDLGVDHAFSFLGLRQDALEIIRAFDVGVLCSDYESTSNALLEYVALEVPVVCTRVGDNALYVQQGCNGFVVQPGSPGELAAAIGRVRAGAVDANCMQAKAKFILENFNAGQVHRRYHEKYLGLYRAVR